MAGERSRASFLLQLGLRAIAAGNTGGARAGRWQWGPLGGCGCSGGLCAVAGWCAAGTPPPRTLMLTACAGGATVNTTHLHTNAVFHALPALPTCRQRAPPLPAVPPGPAAAAGCSACCGGRPRRAGAAAVQVWLVSDRALLCFLAQLAFWAATCCPAHETLSPLNRPILPICRLGAVCGCLGDCCRAEGDAEGTLRHYGDSVALLREAGQDPEVGFGTTDAALPMVHCRRGMVGVPCQRQPCADTEAGHDPDVLLWPCIR